MDGNGRWAKARGVPRLMGHRAGRESVREAVKGCVALGVEVLTLYTFSTENWNRPRREIAALMTILRQTLRAERRELRENNVRLAVIGRAGDLPPEVVRAIAETQEYLAGCDGLLLNLALSYSGRAELVDAVRALIAEGVDGNPLDEARVSAHLYTAGLPDPDLLIRTSGEMRISNFMLWQLAYTELWITDTLWPDFRRRHLYQAVAEFQGRERRFGRVD
ncbi:MAG: di-trans,poly-cis-decaprenylcistransferase [Candidatus Eisenbacteria bacterium]|uniref:Isoprenyl transferase n=1 Tax=Eiseniibacteriota bacterium TaxID=2212470 RepID=A0A9D6L3U2_UNCEI|nr:di-trans,poly-cis-decaprenylcistransferase [Candidatus Eisenbacteria bacterium]MBI3539292.1 di-trans,poly-cis-decaprenylcistransferase [Candidatus Eisenbacteria bacterium]